MLGIGALVLLLLIPISMVQGVIYERQERRAQAVSDVTSKWGGEQRFVGPTLVIPYRRTIVETTDGGESRSRVRVSSAHFLAEELEIDARIDADVRYRGIFEVPVYSMNLAVAGRFAPPDFREWGVEPEDVLWDRARLVVGISDPRAIEDRATLEWNGAQIAFQPGGSESGSAGIHARVADASRSPEGRFRYELALRGSGGAFFAPFARETRVALSSDWPEPSFQGGWLPNEHEVRADGFHATWRVLDLGRNFPQRWRASDSFQDEIDASLFGARLITPVDPYRMAERSAKYGALFLVLTFGTLWLFEVLSKMRIHSLQYLLVGASMCVFYLLELSLAEHIGFAAAYAVASSAIVLLLFGYTAAVLRARTRAAMVAGLVTGLYAYLYVLLRNQDYALLVGSVGLFVALALVMFLTRRVDWHAPALRETP